jgi:hypothetical protein
LEEKIPNIGSEGVSLKNEFQRAIFAVYAGTKY